MSDRIECPICGKENFRIHLSDTFNEYDKNIHAVYIHFECENCHYYSDNEKTPNRNELLIANDIGTPTGGDDYIAGRLVLGIFKPIERGD